MKIFKLILLGIIVTIWLLTSIAYFSLGEWLGFNFMQLLFVPFIAGLLMLYSSKILGIITLSFWFTIIYGITNMPYRDIVMFFPIILLLAFFIRFSIIVEDKFFKILGCIFSGLSFVAFIRALKIHGLFDTDIIIPVGLFAFPIIIFYKSLQIIKSQKSLGIIVMTMSIIVFLQLLIRLFNTLSLFYIPSLLSTSIFVAVVLSLGLTAWMTTKKTEYESINRVTLAYFVFALFDSFALCIANSI